MRYYSQVVSDAVSAEPPRVRGVIDGLTIRRMLSWDGVGRSRRIEFDIVGWKGMSALIRDKMSVALAWDDQHLKLKVALPASTRCPSCGLDLLADEFWGHYNLFHARRMWWLNEEHWRHYAAGKYVTPPEQA